MKIVLLYLRIINRVEPNLPVPESYQKGEQRFLDTYKRFKPETPHQLWVVNCGIKRPLNRPVYWDPIVEYYAFYNGFGSDCGTYQAVGGKIDCDLLVCCNTHVYFWRKDWLQRVTEAYNRNGPGVYGLTSSHYIAPHLRTPCIACHPRLLREYPLVCDSRAKAGDFEHGADNFSLWARRRGYPSFLITMEGAVPYADWRKWPNIFWRGDQSNCLVWDRHTVLYEQAQPAERTAMARYADGLN